MDLVALEAVMVVWEEAEVPILEEAASILVEPCLEVAASRIQGEEAFLLAGTSLLVAEACEVDLQQEEVALEAWGGLQEVQEVGEAFLLEEEQGVACTRLLPSYLEEEELE